MRLRNGVLATGAVATLAAFGLLASVAGAQNTQPTQSPATDSAPHPIALAGQVSKVDTTANSLTVTNPKGSTIVSVSDKTWVLTSKSGTCAQGSLSDIQANQEVRVAGMTTTTPNQVDARTVVQGACFAGKPGPGAGPLGRGKVGPGAGGKVGGGAVIGAIADHVAAGTIKSISGTAIVVTSARGVDVTVNTSTDTVVLNGGFKDPSSLKVGDKVEVLGSPNRPLPAQKPANPPAQNPARTIDAWGIRVVSDNSKVFVGVVDKVDGNTVTIKTRPAVGVSTATLSSSTGYKSATVMDRKVTVTTAVQADVKPGSLVLIEGTPSADGKSVDADAVVVLPTPSKLPRNGFHF